MTGRGTRPCEVEQKSEAIRDAPGSPIRSAILWRMSTASLQGRRAIVITASDRCFAGVQEDRSGPALVNLLLGSGAIVLDLLVSSDDKAALSEHIAKASTRADLVLTTGGTGLSLRDNTPEATLAVCNRLVPGLAELIRREGNKETPFASLGRGVCGVAGACLVLNLPGSLGGATNALGAVLPLLPHALALLAGQTEH